MLGPARLGIERRAGGERLGGDARVFFLRPQRIRRRLGERIEGLLLAPREDPVGPGGRLPLLEGEVVEGSREGGDANHAPLSTAAEG